MSEHRSETALTCSAEGCDRTAVETLFLRGQIGHVHDCPEHAHDLREWCDVVHGEPIIDGECLAVVCTGNAHIHVSAPTPLDPTTPPAQPDGEASA